ATLKALQAQMKSPDYTNARTNTEKNISLYQAQQTVLSQNLQELGNKLQTAKNDFAEILKATPGIETYISYHDEQKSLKQRLLLLQEMQMVAKGYKDPVNAKKYFSDEDAAELTELTKKLKEIESFITSFEMKNTNSEPSSFVGNKVTAYINAQKEIQDIEAQTTQKTNELSIATANYYKMLDTKNKFDSDLLAVTESELKIQSLSTAIGSITTSIQNLTMPDKASTEGLITQLDNYITTYLTKLKSYTDQSSQEYKRDYATLEDFIAKKKQLLSDSKTYQLSKENIDPAKVEALNQQIQSLDDLLTVGKVEQTIEQIESKILEYEQKLTNAVNKTSAQYKTDYEIFTLFVDKKISYLDEKKRIEAVKPEIDNTALESYISDIQKLQTLKNNYDLKEQSASIIDQYMQGLNTAILLDNKQLQETYLTKIKNIYDNDLQKLYESSAPDLVQITQLQKKISEVQMQLDALVVQKDETITIIDDKLSNLQQGYNTAVQMQDNNLQLYFLNQIKDYYDAQLVSFSMLTDSLEKFEDIAALQQNIQKTTNLIDLLKPKETLETKEAEETAQIFGKEMGSNIYEGLLNGLEYAKANNNVQLQVTFLNELMHAYQKELTEAYKLPDSAQKQREIESLLDTIEKVGAEIVKLTPLGSFKGKVYEDTGRSAYESFEQGYKNAYETGNKSMQSLFLGSMKSTLEKEIADLYSKELTIPNKAEITSKESKLNAINALIANLKEISSSPETVETTVTIGQDLGKNIYEGLLTGIDYAASNSDIVLQSDMLQKLLTQYKADYNELIQTAPYPQKEADIQSLKDTINTITSIIEQLTPQILVAEMQKEIDNITNTAGNIINSDSIVQEQFDNIISKIATAKGNIGQLMNETEGSLKTALENMYKSLSDTENQVTAKGIKLGFLTEKEADLKRAYAYAEKISDKETTIKNLIQYYSEELAKAVDSQRDRLKALITEYTKELNSIQINKITAKVEIDLDSINAEMQEKKNDVPFFEKFFAKDNISIFSPKTADIELENAKEILRVRREAYLELQKYKLTQEELSEEDKKKIELAGEESEKAEEIYKKKLKEKELRIEIYSQYQKTIDSLTEAGAISSEFAGILKDIGSLALQANVAFQLINTTLAANPIVALLYGLLLVVQAIASVINRINTNSAKALERQTAFNAALETQLELEKEYQKTKQYNQTNIQALKEEYTLMDDYMKKRNIAETEYQEAVDEFNSAYADYMAQMNLWALFRNGDMLTKAQERMDKAIEKMKKAGATIDEINQKIAEMPFNMAAELGVGLSEITNTIANEMQSALDKGLSFEQFQSALETSLKKATRNALIKALVDSLIIEKLKPYIEQLGNEILKGNDPKNSLAAFLENMKKIISDPRLKEI
ncbi:MAG TPA: hypothetical protein PLV89_10675, partial [Treponemataceae bacterium]|nr:hypothetical protein [Treponemataceae bacterium]